MQEFVDLHGIDFVQIADFDQTVWTQWGVVSQPAFVFLNEGTNPVGHLGAISADGLTEQLEALL